MKIPNKKILAHLKKWNNVNWDDIRNHYLFKIFEVEDSVREVLTHCESTGHTWENGISPLCMHFPTKDGTSTQYYGVLQGQLTNDAKDFFALNKKYIKKDGFTYLLTSNRFVCEFNRII